MHKLYTKIGVLIIFFSVFLIPAGCAGEQLEFFEETRTMMDTFVTVAVYSEAESAQDIIDAAFNRMEEIEAIATTWDSKGEAWRLNETGVIENPSPELLELINLSLEYNRLTDGYFDITVQPLLDLWQYNPEAEKQFWEIDPSEQVSAIEAAKEFVGSDCIIIEGDSIRLKEGCAITLGGIAKGYAADEALKTVSEMGIKYAFIDAGGDIRTLGSKPDGEKWGIALVNPDDTSQFLAGFLVSGQAVTTSGNYERYFNPDKSVHHILNPKTGYSAGECISVTIVAEDGAMADALATGVFVMGPDEGMKFVESLDGVEALIVDSDRNIYRSSGLAKYLAEE